ncbi:beta 1-4 rhamnosyltransferase Cps2T [Leuconostoc lactis]|uniref:beta 1-4 rhamnosyltransferase Cps2T n=1 Tax=Leuconostoc lactis TaxID=1246 RepID=UPI003B28CB51
MKHIYIIGSKGIPARYGGYETFVDKLTEGQQSDEIKYHVASRRDNSELSEVNDIFEYNNAEVFSIDVPNIGPAQAILYDIKSLQWAIKNAKEIGAEAPIFYILAARIGPFMGHYVKQIHALGGSYFINPDGHEWKRAKWPLPVRKYWKISERGMIKHADLVIADNRKIEEYVLDEYDVFKPRTTFIAYGTDTIPTTLESSDESVRSWYKKHDISENGYYLIVGRFVPENNYETMIREFMASESYKDLVIVTNVEKNKFYQNLLQKTGFDKDKRIKFVGTVYDQPLLRYIRENAYAYLHGHEVGGTNPSLLEALSSTQLNLLIDVDFNKTVARNTALYWSKNATSLATIIKQADNLDEEKLMKFKSGSKEIIMGEYKWESIIQKYEGQFEK